MLRSRWFTPQPAFRVCCRPSVQSTGRWYGHPACRPAYHARRIVLFSYAYATALTRESLSLPLPTVAETHPEPSGRASGDHPPDPESAESLVMKTPVGGPYGQNAAAGDPRHRTADSCYPDSGKV